MALASQPESTRRQFPRPRSMTSARLTSWVALFLVIAGVRLAFVASFGSAMPLLDQWDDEGARTFKPYLEGTLGFRQAIAPHNEHRPLVSRLLALSLLILNGEWDARLQMAVNAILAAAVAVLVASVGESVVGSRHRAGVLLAVACWSCLPYAWENTTWAFQSSFYFLVGFSVLAICGLLLHRPFSRRWIIGGVAALLATFSMGSGFLCAGAVLLVSGVRVITRRAALREAVPTVVVCAAIMALGLGLRVYVPDHDVLRAQSLEQWVNVFARGLAWPYTRRAVAAVVICLPVAALAILYVRRRALLSDNMRRGTEVVLALVAWIALQSAAIALTRGSGIYAGWMSPRYLDVLAIGTLANFLALLLLVSLPLRSAGLRHMMIVAMIAWVAFVLVGAVQASRRGFRDMRTRAEQVLRAEANVRAYLATPDPALLSTEATRIAYPWSDRFATLLNDSTIRSTLPAALRQDVAAERRARLSAASDRLLGHGIHIAIAGATIAAAVALNAATRGAKR